MLTRSMESFEQVRPAPLRVDFREPDQDGNENPVAPAGPGRFLSPSLRLVRVRPFWGSEAVLAAA